MMNARNLAVSAVSLVLLALAPLSAEARVFIGIGLGGGYYGQGWGYPYSYSYPPYYAQAYPPPVIYALPPPAMYAAPPAVTVYTMSYPAPYAVQADQTSPTFVDSYGRTCRQFQASGPGAAIGVACLQSDGAWRIVQ